jgi:hypothetical protein
MKGGLCCESCAHELLRSGAEVRSSPGPCVKIHIIADELKIKATHNTLSRTG